MLKKFLLNMLSSFVGAWIALVLVLVAAVLLIFGMIGNMALSTANVEQLSSKSILRISLKGVIEEREAAGQPDMASLISGNLERPQSLNVIVEGLREAARNKNIKGVYLDCGYVSASLATLNAIRNEIIEFRKTTDNAKPVYAYGGTMSMGAYFVASAADRIYLNPEGELSINGMSSTVMYYKDLLDKLGVEFQVVKVGTFKSAVEPYILQEMSEPARAQMDTLLTNMWGYVRKSICEERNKVLKGDKLSPQLIDTLVSVRHIAMQPAQELMKSGLVDSLLYGRKIDEVFARISSQKPEDVNYVGPSTLVAQVPWGQAYSSKHRIAVLYATGEIQDGNKNPGYIDYETLVPIINELADDEHCDGMVLRVNSPGGAVYGSAQIGEALDYFKSKGKPLAVSMGDYAASGGYWISCCADKIFADPLTITGSIGIFGLIPNFQRTAQMIGVNPQTVSTNPAANFPTGIAPMTPDQQAVMQAYVNRGYEQFVGRVAKGRRMNVDAVKRIAEGRVWDAMTARRIGLVDSLGNMQNAVEWVAREAKVYDKYEVAAYPKLQPSIWDFLADDAMAQFKVQWLAPKPEDIMLRQLRTILARKNAQALMPEIKVSLN